MAREALWTSLEVAKALVPIAQTARFRWIEEFRVFPPVKRAESTFKYKVAPAFTEEKYS